MSDEDGIYTGRWKVDLKEYPGHVELCVIREDFQHGFRSYGWFGPAKHLIFDGKIDQKVWKDLKPTLLAAAENVARRFNRDIPS